eukprot:TRINITY_DN52787_c0_g1_i1.p1 TRINITY_DN52787_c0_g1~~TRINITY_DN52787_c0_g1_i1.p1  ORF type:complete len:187 (+),score=26.43 TRINITY_DN52787_c0_g1_i1:39-599(+)
MTTEPSWKDGTFTSCGTERVDVLTSRSVRQVKICATSAVVVNLCLGILFWYHYSSLPVSIFDSLFSDSDADYLIPPDDSKPECVNDDTPIPGTSGSYLQRAEADLEWLAEQVEHRALPWKGPRHKTIWTPGPYTLAAILFFTFALNAIGPYVIKVSELERKLEAKKDKVAAEAVNPQGEQQHQASK